MTNWMLTFSLLIIFYINYRCGKRCYLSPSVIVTAVMLMSSIVVSINTDYWEERISLSTYFIIVCSVVIFSLIEIIIEKNNIYIVLFKGNYISRDNYLVLPKYFYFVCIVFGIVTVILFFVKLFSHASIVGVITNFSSLIQANRYGEDSGISTRFDLLVRLLFIMLKCMVSVALFVQLYNKVINEKRENFLKLIILSVLYFICCVLTTNRSDVIAFAITFIFMYLFISYFKKGWIGKKIRKGIGLKIVLIFVIALIAFRLLGYLTGKSDTYSLYDNMCIYMGSPIVCFDKFINGSGVRFISEYKPQLFKGIYSVINLLGGNIQINNYVFPHQYWNHAGSNIYTSLFVYYYKYGMIGLFFIESILGFLYGIMWKNLKKQYVKISFIVIYCNLFFYYIVMYFAAERFFSMLFTITSVFEIVTIIGLCRLIKYTK